MEGRGSHPYSQRSVPEHAPGTDLARCSDGRTGGGSSQGGDSRTEAVQDPKLLYEKMCAFFQKGSIWIRNGTMLSSSRKQENPDC